MRRQVSKDRKEYVGRVETGPEMALTDVLDAVDELLGRPLLGKDTAGGALDSLHCRCWRRLAEEDRYEKAGIGTHYPCSQIKPTGGDPASR